MNARRLLALFLAVVAVLCLAACGGSSNSVSQDAMEVPKAEMSAGSDFLASDSAASTQVPADRKLIRTVSMDAETDELEPLLAALEAQIAALNGYVENRNVYNGSSYSSRRYRHAELTVRIPAENLDSFVTHVSGVSNVVSSNEQIEDVTLTYVDMETRVAALETEQERLLALMEQAQTLSDLLEIESRLTEVNYQLESWASQLKALENQVSYSTVRLYISEVQEYTPVAEKTVWQRITEGFADSLEGIADGAVEIAVWILANSPYIVLFGGIGTGLAVLLKKRKRKVSQAPRKPEASE